MALELIKTDGETEKIPDPRIRLVAIFNSEYEERTGRKNPVSYGWCMKKLYKQFVTVDEETGECFIEYPDIDTWQEQVNGFWEDDWAKTKAHYHFSYLLKQFGRFASVEKREAPIDRMLEYHCPHCGTVARAKKSEWGRFANKKIKCSNKECEKPFSVNTVLNQIPDVSQLLRKE